MSILSSLADRMILQATTHYVDPEGRERRMIPTAGADIEAWITRSNDELGKKTPIVILKFPGTGGRAERSGPHPAEHWDDVAAEVWTINHRGYGGSPGPASLANFMETCESIWKCIAAQFPERKIVVCGNSLGCLSALYLSARYPVVGVYLRNPPALAQMIATRPRYAWWNFGMSRLITDQVPEPLDSIENAKRSSCAALFIQSELDRVTPPRFQNEVIDHFGGEKQTFVIHGADHHHPITEAQHGQYLKAIRWLEARILANSPG